MYHDLGGRFGLEYRMDIFNGQQLFVQNLLECLLFKIQFHLTGSNTYIYINRHCYKEHFNCFISAIYPLFLYPPFSQLSSTIFS